MEYATRDEAQNAVNTLSNQQLMGRLVYVREVGSVFCLALAMLMDLSRTEKPNPDSQLLTRREEEDKDKDSAEVCVVTLVVVVTLATTQEVEAADLVVELVVASSTLQTFVVLLSPFDVDEYRLHINHLV